MNNNIEVKIKYVSEKIGSSLQPPFYATSGSAGMDLSACMDEPVTMEAGQKIIVPTGIAIQLPSNQYVAFVFARSGLGIKHGIALSNGVGVIDSDYTGEIMCGLVNLGDQRYTIKPGDRIAQMVFMPVAIATLVQTNHFEHTERGAGGFGSTGA